MAYTTVENIEDLSGFGYKDMKSGGVTMTEAQFDAFVERKLAAVCARVHKFCNVRTFEEHEVVEFHEGRWPQDPYDWPRFPGAIDRAYITGQFYSGIEAVFFPRELPVISVEEVAEDATSYNYEPAWQVRVPRQDPIPATETEEAVEGVPGDYQVFTRQGLTWIQFHRNIPRGRPQNLRLTYTAGYEAGSQELADITDIIERITANYLIYKRRVQEYQTLRATGAADFQKPLEQTDILKWIMTKDTREDLQRHVQKPGLSPDLFSF